MQGSYLIDCENLCHLGEVFLDDMIFYHEKQSLSAVKDSARSWYTTHAGTTTTIYANFGSANPNTQSSEINARELVFGSKTLHLNYITIDGLSIMQSAENWDKQENSTRYGLITTSGGKGWIIQNCIIKFAKMRGISMDHDGQVDDYNLIGHHIIRDNIIEECGHAGVSGHAASASVISGNWIRNIHGTRPYFGVEQGGIKLHYAQDVLISGNIISRVDAREFSEGIWLDWQCQNNRITGNVIMDIGTVEASENTSIHIEMSHGPNLVDNNILLFTTTPNPTYYYHPSYFSDGTEIVNNLLFNTTVNLHKPDGRSPEYYAPHSLNPKGNAEPDNNDIKIYNNLFIKKAYFELNTGLGPNSLLSNNAFMDSAEKYNDVNSVTSATRSNFTYALDTINRSLTISFNVGSDVVGMNCPLITSNLLGVVNTVNYSIQTAEGNPITVDKDAYQVCRGNAPMPGPFQSLKSGLNTFTIHPNSNFNYSSPCLATMGTSIQPPGRGNGHKPLLKAISSDEYYSLSGQKINAKKKAALRANTVLNQRINAKAETAASQK